MWAGLSFTPGATAVLSSTGEGVTAAGVTASPAEPVEVVAATVTLAASGLLFKGGRAGAVLPDPAPVGSGVV